MDVERRRSSRVSFLQEEAAVVHAGGREILVRIVDCSQTGALLSLLDIPGLSEGVPEAADYGESVVVSMHVNHSLFQIAARVVRTTPGFVAVEFADTITTEFNGTFSESS